MIPRRDENLIRAAVYSHNVCIMTTITAARAAVDGDPRAADQARRRPPHPEVPGQRHRRLRARFRVYRGPGFCFCHRFPQEEPTAHAHAPDPVRPEGRRRRSRCPIEERLRQAWERYGNTGLRHVRRSSLAGILAKGGWDYLVAQKELGIQKEFADVHDGRGVQGVRRQATRAIPWPGRRS